jgi:non-ribosomal peptide synthetase component F
MAVLAAWATAVGRWTGEPEVVVMSPVPGRTRPQDAAVIGCLVQSLLLRVPVGDRPTPERLLARVRRTVLRATDHQYHPYEEFSRAVRRPTWLRFENWAAPAHLPGLVSEPFPLPRELMYDWPLTPEERGPAAPELALTVQPDGSWAGWLVANAAAQPAAPVHELAASFLVVLADGAAGGGPSDMDRSGAQR